jgi:hypothetical protein
MFEPKYEPKLDELLESLSGMRFSVRYSNEYVSTDDPGADPLHIHNYLEIFLNISSDISFCVNNNLYSVSAGNAVISCPGDIHMGIFHKSSVHEHICIWVDANFTTPIFSFLRNENFCPSFSFDEKTKKKLQSLALSLFDTCEKGGS